VENPARSVDKEEKTCVELIIRAHLLERITQVANTTSFVLSAELGDVIILINNKLSLGSYIR
jgi:hypothetical protein